jgi:FAD/FMN-containing dehydrogenase
MAIIYIYGKVVCARSGGQTEIGRLQNNATDQNEIRCGEENRMGAERALSNKRSASNKLKTILGAGKVRDDEITLVTYGRICHGFDFMTPFRKPSLVVFPESRDDVVETLKIANGYKIPVTSLGTAQIMLMASEGGIILDHRRFNQIREINKDAGYAVIEPGVSFDQLTSALRGTGYKCAVGTMPGPGTVLGQTLGRGSQSFSTRYLNLILDLEVVLPDGTVFTTGSSHFAGASSHMRYGPFPDLAGLYTCAYGTLGVITKAAIRIHPMNQVHKVHFAGFNRYADSVDYIRELIDNNIPEHAFIWDWHMYLSWPLAAEDMPGIMPRVLKSDVRKPPPGTPYNLVSTLLSGFSEVVEAYEKVCAKLARKYHGRVISEEEMKKRFPATLAGFKQQYEDFHYREAVHWSKGRFQGWYVFAEPEKIKKVEQFAIKEMTEFGKGINPISYYSHPFDYGRSILLRVAGFPDPADTQLRARMRQKFLEMHTLALKNYGAVPIRPMGEITSSGSYMEVLQRIKQALDPNNILGRDAGLFEEVKR